MNAERSGADSGRPESGETAGALLVLAAACLWGLIGIFGTYAQRAGLSPMDVAWWRAAFGTVCFGVHALLVRARFPRGRDLVTTAFFGLVAGAVFYAAYQVAVRTGGAGLASVLLYTAPAFVAVLGVPVLRERLGRLEIAAVVTSICGVGLVAAGGGMTVTVVSITAGLLAGLTYSLTYLYGRDFYRRYDPAACLAVALGVAVVALTPTTSPALLSPGALLPAWWAVVGVGVASTYVGFLLHSLGLRRIAATRASVIATIEPVVAVLLAAVLFGERPGAVAVLGGVVVLISAVILALAPRRA